MTLLYTLYSTPSASSASRTCRMASSLSTVASVTTATRLAPRFFRSMPTSLVTPGPKRIDDAAISNAYSFCCETSRGVANPRRATLDAVRSAKREMVAEVDGWAWWWWLGLEWQGQFGGWLYWTVRRRLTARAALWYCAGEL